MTQMIERYSLSPMKELWTLEAQYQRWLDVELAVVEAYEEAGVAPPGTARFIKEKVRIDVQKILEKEKETHHDVAAFVSFVVEQLGSEGRFFHFGLTSSDIVDTALSMALKMAGDLILSSLTELLNTIWEMATRHHYTLIVGRTHGVHAEPTSFGLKLLNWYAMMKRNKRRLERAVEEISHGKISGAVGNYAHVSPEIERKALEKLGLKPIEVSTQIVPRDVHASFVQVLALLGSSLEVIALEIRHLQRTEVLEVEEPFMEKQKGSSAMPHKRNPVISERLCGLARLLRSYSIVALENIPLWHERDISHSSAERFVFPDVTGIVFYMVETLRKLLENLKINEEKMRKNLELTRGLIYSQRVLNALIESGFTREDAYAVVQELSNRAWEENRDFYTLVKEDKRIRDVVPEKVLELVFDPGYYLRNVDEIYKRFEEEDE
ncbi:MAG: adenylosuccinate lyase [Thermotogota bacterium]|nr:adenylosuccinate lyase [Thermotogota bacterium]MDK2864662.1 adenylosuccinate lyase [Thermotogota bacterium]